MPYRYPIQFGKYLLVARVAVGGMAEVFKAKLVGPRGFEKTLAVKKILPEFSQDEDFVQMFVDEARISSHLHHANIVQVYDFGEVSGSYYIAMEYVDGANLKSLFQKVLKAEGKLSRPLALYFGLEIARALDYAHNVSVEGEQILHLVHRDISPQNVLVSREGEVKITDFGIAKATIKLTKTQPGKVQGKLSYMSPEQATGKPLDRRSDLFSLGVILYELLTGIKVYTGGNTGEKYLKIRNADIAPIQTLVPDLPDQLCTLVTAMLSKDPEARPANAGTIVQALSDALTNFSKEELQNQIRELINLHFPPEKSDSSLGRRIQEAVSRGQPVAEPETQIRSGILEPLIDTPQELPKAPELPVDPEKTKPIRALTFAALLASPWVYVLLASVVLAAAGLGAYYYLGGSPELATLRPRPNIPKPIATPEQVIPTPQQSPIPIAEGPMDLDIKEEALLRQMEMEEKIKDLEDQVRLAEVRATEKALEARLAAEKLAKQQQTVAAAPKSPCPSDMMRIRAGDFYYGSDSSDPDRNELIEVGLRKESFERDYCIDTYEFPNRQGAKPVGQVTWTEALAECKKISKRLCTQEEWERACRGGVTTESPKRIYSYGNVWKTNACAIIEDEERLEERNHSLAASGSYPKCKSPDGVFDLLGNAEEWTQSEGVFGQSNRVVKGGSLTSSTYLARCASRREVPVDTRRDELSFRCCKDAQ